MDTRWCHDPATRPFLKEESQKEDGLLLSPAPQGGHRLHEVRLWSERQPDAIVALAACGWVPARVDRAGGEGMQGTQVLTLPVDSLALGSTKAAPRWVEENRCNRDPQAPRVEREWPELSTRVRRWVGRERVPRRPPAPPDPPILAHGCSGRWHPVVTNSYNFGCSGHKCRNSQQRAPAAAPGACADTPTAPNCHRPSGFLAFSLPGVRKAG